ncbi:MAG: hypothetical protein M1831_005188 [Alyxoria varia]|nr:MAG: hypothetical protein M1831_005188 [Alyxoria varia]
MFSKQLTTATALALAILELSSASPTAQQGQQPTDDKIHTYPWNPPELPLPGYSQDAIPYQCQSDPKRAPDIADARDLRSAIKGPSGYNVTDIFPEKCTPLAWLKTARVSLCAISFLQPPDDQKKAYVGGFDANRMQVGMGGLIDEGNCVDTPQRGGYSAFGSSNDGDYRFWMLLDRPDTPSL